MEKRFVWAIRKKNWLFLPVAFLLAVMPVVIRATQHFLSGDLYRLFFDWTKNRAFFSIPRPLFMDYGGGYADFGTGILEKAFFWN